MSTMHRSWLPVALLLAGVLALLATGRSAAASHSDTAGFLHIEASAGTSDSFNFEAPAYVGIGDPTADIRLGIWPDEVDNPSIGYRLLVGLNGALVANIGVVNYAATGCAAFDTAPLRPKTSTYLGADPAPALGTVYLVKTAGGALVKMELTLVDFTNPNGLGWNYVLLDCEGDTDIDGVPDAVDQCIAAPDRTVVVGDVDTGVPEVLGADGCSLSQAIAAAAVTSESHGVFVRLVAGLVKDLPGRDRGVIVSAAARLR